MTESGWEVRDWNAAGSAGGKQRLEGWSISVFTHSEVLKKEVCPAKRERTD